MESIKTFYCLEFPSKENKIIPHTYSKQIDVYQIPVVGWEVKVAGCVFEVTNIKQDLDIIVTGFPGYTVSLTLRKNGNFAHSIEKLEENLKKLGWKTRNSRVA